MNCSRHTLKNGVNVSSIQSVTPYCLIFLPVHSLNIAGVSPEAVMDGGEGDTLGPEVERRQHHVRTVQRVDKVRRESVSIFARVYTEARLMLFFVFFFQKPSIKVHFFITL